MSHLEKINKELSQNDIIKTFSFLHACLTCNDTKTFHENILSFADYLGFEFVLYGYTLNSYTRRHEAQVVNLTNPHPWEIEYESEHMEHDPVVNEFERRIARNESEGFFIWDTYDQPLSKDQQKVIDRRRSFGLEYGCSLFINSRKKDFSFILSLADRKTYPDKRIQIMAMQIASPLLQTAKRLQIVEIINSLSKKEMEVAYELMNGRTNWEIGSVLGVSVNTVKYHIKNIFIKLNVYNRQQAIGVLLAERYLSPLI